MSIGEGRAAELHGPWADHEERRLAALRVRFPGYRVWRAMRDDRTRTDWCARHGATGDEFTEGTDEGLAEQLDQHRERTDG